MNITELARILRINPQQLRNMLPELGFSIGQKAIKVDNNTAKKIIRNWSTLKREWEQKQLEEEIKKQDEVLPKEKKTIKVPPTVTVRNYVELSGIPANRVLAELMKNGVFVSINEKIDFDTAAIIGENLNLEVVLVEDEVSEESQKEKLSKVLSKEKEADLEERPPVIVVMGHVDHGKTRLLDSIRKTDVVAGEAGGITQHIGAYQVKRKDHLLTFIDTPGHEAFTAMRSRGAKVADIAILVVAADDGVKQQTVEAYRIIETAKIPFLVAINKIDKETADIDKVKQELSTKLNLTPEDWGGKTICVPISALQDKGIEELLDMVLLLSETESGQLMANPDSDAIGTVIESNVDKGAGPLATILIQNGTLKIGDQLCYDQVIYGKVKALKNYRGEDVKEVGPSAPAKVIGLKVSPTVGDVLVVGEGQRLRLKKMKAQAKQEDLLVVNTDDNESEDKIPTVNVIIKADYLGSAEAVEESLLKLNTEKVQVRVLSKGLGYITEGDVSRAESANAKILGFNVKISPQIETLIRDKKIVVEIFSIIYDLIKYVEEDMKLLVKPEMRRSDLGSLKVLAIFRTDNNSQIVGGQVSDGELRNLSNIEVWREGKLITTGKLNDLQTSKQSVESVESGNEAGIKFEGKPLIEVGDVLKSYVIEEVFSQD